VFTGKAHRFDVIDIGKWLEGRDQLFFFGRNVESAADDALVAIFGQFGVAVLAKHDTLASW
jgi:hypothetical protein